MKNRFIHFKKIVFFFDKKTTLGRVSNRTERRDFIIDCRSFNFSNDFFNRPCRSKNDNE